MKKTYPDSSETVFAYDQFGRMTGAANPTAGYSFFYNELNRLLEYNLLLEGEEYAVSYGWDPVGNKTGLTYPGGTEYTRHYDNLNRLERVENSAEEVLAEYAYDDLNRRSRLDYLNGTWAAYTYNNSGWLTDLVNWRTETEVVSEFAYTNDNVGNRLSMTTPDGTHSYGYDDIYQLIAADYPAGYPFPDMTYYYDAAYNRTTTVNGGEVDYLSNNLNQYTNVGAAALGYDDNGNLTGDGSQTYYYDVENRLTRAVRNSDGQTLGEYAYDPFGRRIVKEAGGTTTHYIYDHLSYQVLAEYVDGGGGFSPARRFVYGVGIDEPLVMETGGAGGGGGRYFYHRDGLGSVADLTDESGQTTAAYRYDVYGNFQLTGTSQGNPYTFTGRRLDEETGLYFYRARYYSPGLGRFLQVDPIRYDAGPNLYSYVSNRPINYMDPSGNMQELVSIANDAWTMSGEEIATEVEAEHPGYGASGRGAIKCVVTAETCKCSCEGKIYKYEVIFEVLCTVYIAPYEDPVWNNKPDFEGISAYEQRKYEESYLPCFNKLVADAKQVEDSQPGYPDNISCAHAGNRLAGAMRRRHTECKIPKW